MFFACSNARFAVVYAFGTFRNTAFIHRFASIGTGLTALNTTFTGFDMMGHSYLVSMIENILQDAKADYLIADLRP